MTATLAAPLVPATSLALPDAEAAPDFQTEVAMGDRRYELSAFRLRDGRQYALEITGTDTEGEILAQVNALVSANELRRTKWMFGRLTDEVVGAIRLAAQRKERARIAAAAEAGEMERAAVATGDGWAREGLFSGEM